MFNNFSSLLSFVDSRLRQASLRLAIVGMPLGVLLICGQAQATSLDASTEVWIRSTNPTTTFVNDAMSVRHEDVTGDMRYSVVEFDLSGITSNLLIGASLELTVRSTTANVQQDSFLIDTTGGTAASSMTWNAYQGEQEGSEAFSFESFGVEPLAQGFSGGTVRETFASANDLAQIQSILSSGGVLTVSLKPASSSTNVDWTDAGLDGMPAVLNLTFIPEPTSILLLGLGGVLLCGCRRLV